MCGPMFALSGFAVALSAGIIAGAAARPLLVRGIVVLIACYVIGRLAGLVLDHIVARVLAREHAVASVAPVVRGAEGQTSENLERDS